MVIRPIFVAVASLFRVEFTFSPPLSSQRLMHPRNHNDAFVIELMDDYLFALQVLVFTFVRMRENLCICVPFVFLMHNHDT